MTNFRATFLRSGSFIALGLLLPASAAIGQAPAVEDGDEVAIEDIVVTARGREQSLHDVSVVRTFGTTRGVDQRSVGLVLV